MPDPAASEGFKNIFRKFCRKGLTYAWSMCYDVDVSKRGGANPPERIPVKEVRPMSVMEVIALLTLVIAAIGLGLTIGQMTKK